MSEPYFRVTPCDAALRDLKLFAPVWFKNRDKDLPDVYIYVGTHPQRVLPPRPGIRIPKSPEGTTYVVFADTSPEGKAQERKRVTSLTEMPVGRERDIQERYGLVELQNGDWLFARDKDGDGDPTKDMLQAIVVHDGALEELFTKLEASAQPMLGTQEYRAQHSHTAFENTLYAKAVRVGSRCFSLGQLVQHSRSLSAPAAHLKVGDDGELDEEQTWIRRFVADALTYAVAGWQMAAPIRIQEWQEEYGDLINLPQTGCDGNKFFAAVQLNIAKAQAGNSDGRMDQEMKFFATIHRDEHDNTLGFSVMVVLSDLLDGPGWEPGRFHLITRGFYVVLRRGSQVFFSGRLPHGGTAPLAPEGQEPPSWALRFVVIGYPPRAIMEGDTRHTLAAMPMGGHPIHLTPEMTGIDPALHIARTNSTNYARDGIMIMTVRSLVQFFVRSLLLLCFFLCRQLPSRTRIQIDRDRFLSAFTAVDEDGNPIRLDSWELGPTGSVHQPPQPDSRRQQVIRSHRTDFYEHLQGAIDTAPNTHPALGKGKGGQPAKPRPKVPGDGDPKSKDGTKGQPKLSKDQVGGAGVIETSWDMNFAAQGKQPVFSMGEIPPAELVAVTPGSQSVPQPLRSALQVEAPAAAPQTGLATAAPQDRAEHPLERAPLHVQPNTVSDQPSSSLVYVEPPTPSGTASLGQTAPPSRATTPAEPNTEAPSDELDPVSAVLGASSGKDAPSDPRTDGLLSVSTSGPGDIEDLIEEDEEGFGDDERVTLRCTASEAAFLNAFSLGRLRQQVQNVQDAIALVHRLPLPSIARTMETLNKVKLGTVAAYEAPDALKMLAALHNAKDHALLNSITSRLLYQRVMVCETHFNTTLLDTIRDNAHDIALALSLNPTAHALCEDNPLLFLGIEVHRCLHDRVPRSFPASSYLPHIFGTTSTLSYTFTGPFLYHVTEQDAADLVISIIRHWFARPKDAQVMVQASFIYDLNSSLGYGSLYVPEVWSIYQDLPRWLFSKTGNAYRQSELRLHFLDLIQSIPLANPSSEEFRTVVKLKESYQELSVAIRFQYISSSRSMPALGGPSVDASDVVRPGPSSLHPAFAQEDGMRDEAQEVTLQGRWVAKALVILRSGIKISRARDDGTLAKTALSALEQYMTKNIPVNYDARQPFRELGISRSYVNGRLGTRISAEDIMHPSGFFSVLVFRNILFNARYLHAQDIPIEERRFLFRDVEDFRRHLASILDRHPHYKDTKGFFCYLKAYGGTSVLQRSLDNVDIIWQVANTTVWRDLVARGVPVRFEDGQAVLKLIGAIIPGFGGLTEWLTLADLCMHGIVQHPSPEQMGEVVWRLNKGALKALAKAGFVECPAPPPNKPKAKPRPPKDQVITAFQTFYHQMSVMLGDQGFGDEYAQWNTITAEHVLCKVTRLGDHMA